VSVVDQIRKPSDGTVVAVSRGRGHDFSKTPSDRIRLLAGLGVEGDAHLGKTDQHRSHVRKDPTRPNLRQVHLIHAELFEELRQRGFGVRPGDLGENITTSGIDLLALSAGTKLHLGATAVVEVTGLRNPCVQIDKFQRGLMVATLDKDAAGNLIRKTGIMSIVLAGGEVRPDEPILVERPAGIPRSLPVV
jgi:MOSC domain-containing protein YiiM